MCLHHNFWNFSVSLQMLIIKCQENVDVIIMALKFRNQYIAERQGDYLQVFSESLYVNIPLESSRML